MLRPIPAIIDAGATDNDPDSITVLYGGSSSLSTPAPLLNGASVGTSPPGAYVVAGPLAFSPNDVIVAVQGTNCTLSIVNAGGVSVAVSHRHRDDQPHVDGHARQQRRGDLRGRRGLARQPGAGGVARRAGAIRADRSTRSIRARRHAADAEPAADGAAGHARGQQRRQPEGAVRPRHGQRRQRSMPGSPPPATGRRRTCRCSRRRRGSRSARCGSRS